MIASYKIIFFDVGGTLFRPYPSVGVIYHEVAKRYGYHTDPEDLQTRFMEAWKKRDGLASLESHSNEKIEREWWKSLVHEVFLQVGKVDDFEGFFDELHDVFGRPASWRFYPESLDVLNAIKQRGQRIGVISNWDSRLFRLLDELGIRSYFEIVLASAVFGVSKPSPKIFKEALEQTGVKPEEAIHVGDSIEDDIHGARGARIPAVLVDRHGHDTTRLSKEVKVIHNLMELLE